MIPWICFEWKTDTLPKDEVSVEPLVIRTAEKDEKDAVARTIKSAFSLDPTWGDVSKPLEEKFSRDLESTFSQSEPSCMVLAHGARIIGASILEVAPDSPNHLISGPCILHEYRNRGLASGLLAASLAFLRKKELPIARGITRANSITARFISSKFGGTQRPFEGDPLKTA